MPALKHLFDNNRDWAQSIAQHDPDFFRNLSQQQSPHYFWIGCSDSRVPANQIIGLLPGDVFVHRNVANIVAHSDLNCLSALQFAVDVLKIRHIIVCGHYGCGGVQAVMNGQRHGLVDNWLCHVHDVYASNESRLKNITDSVSRFDALCELNVIQQVRNVCQTSIVNDAWSRGQELTVHGWIYGLQDGLLRDLSVSIELQKDVAALCDAAVARK